MLPMSVTAKPNLAQPVSLVKNNSMLLTIENILSTSPNSSGRSRSIQSSPDREYPSRGAISLGSLRPGLYSREYSPGSLSSGGESRITISESNGFLEAIGYRYCWLRSVRFSEDVYSQNSVFELTSTGHIRLRILKKIQAEEEIIAWFADDLALFMSINFLSPANIKGNNCYVCHVCRKSFPSPNPLKIHIATSCGRQTEDMLWMRLHYSQSKPAPPVLKHSPFKSAFESVPMSMMRNTMPTMPQSAASAFEAAAQIETLVSNMGTSKQGHLCIYCGKVYSRKYGLKIHIRTHTGFKPLKCKYCFRPFGDPSNLNKHLRLHTQNESSHKCHLCNKVVSRRRDLQRHMETKHIFYTQDQDGSNVSCEDEVDGEIINVDEDEELSSEVSE